MSVFSVTWRIENFSMCVNMQREVLYSPIFTHPQLNNMKWKIWLYPRGDSRVADGNYISCFLGRMDKDPSAGKKKLSTSFVIVNTEPNLSLETTSDSFVIDENESRGYTHFMSHTQLHKNPRGFLPNGILKFQLHFRPIFDDKKTTASPDTKNIFSSNPLHLNFTVEKRFYKDSETENVLLTDCSFLTRIPVERRIVDWRIKNLSSKRKSKAKTSVLLESEEVPGVKFLLVCYVKGSREDDESLWIDISRKGMDRRRAFVKCEISFTNSSNGSRGFQKNEHFFDDTYHRWSFSLIDKLSSSQELIIDDSLQMKCDLLISYAHQNIDHLIQNDSCYEDLRAEIQKMTEYEYEDTSDAIFECKSGKKYPVHKFLLFAKSPVFRAMFASDLLEKQTGEVRMQDTDSTTVQQLRDYLYLKNFPDLGAEGVIKLYSVAEKYQIKKLKEKCAGVLKSNMAVENVCEILTFADMHQDIGLKNYAYDFLIAEMDFDSNVWKTFMKENLSLAAETMRKCFVKEKKEGTKI